MKIDYTGNPSPDDFSDFVPAIRFAVASDAHIDGPEADGAWRLEKLFESAYAFAERSPYPKLDAVFLLGDMAGSGRREDWAFYNSLIAKHARAGTEVVTLLGNHEFDGDRDATVGIYREMCHPETDRHLRLGGFHFITLSLADKHNYTDETMDFLRRSVEEAVRDDPGKPVFVFQHRHIEHTVYASSWCTNRSEEFHELFSKYPQVVDFSGHSHAPINNPRSIWQGTFTALGTGTLFVMEMEEGMTCGTIPPDAGDVAQYYIVECDRRGRVRIWLYDILTDDLFETPGNRDPKGTKMVWYLDPPGSPFRYVGREKKAGPRFDPDAAAEADVTSSTVRITFPQARDDECIYSYDLTYTDGERTGKVSFFSEYYFEPIPPTAGYELTDLEPDTVYGFTVTPYDCYGNAGAPLTGSFRTAKE